MLELSVLKFESEIIMQYNKKRTGKRIGEIKEAIPEGVVFGRNAVIELLKSDRDIDKIMIKSGEHEGSLTLIISLAKNRGIPIVEVGKEKLDYLSSGGVHQGVVALASGTQYVEIDEIIEYANSKNEKPFIVVCDGVEDPHNLGAIIRCAEGAGAHGVIISKRHSAPVSATVVKASAGALAHMKISRVVNIASVLDTLKEKGLWVYGAEADGVSVYESDMSGAVALVVGSEGQGMSRLVREKCDFVLSIPMYGKVNSFNVSCAAAVLLCHAARCRNK